MLCRRLLARAVRQSIARPRVLVAGRRSYSTRDRDDDLLSEWIPQNFASEPSQTPSTPSAPPPGPYARARDSLASVLLQLSSQEAANAVERMGASDMALFQDLMFKMQDKRLEDERLSYLMHLLSDVLAKWGFITNVDVLRPSSGQYKPPAVEENEGEEVDILGHQEIQGLETPQYPNLLTHDPLLDAHESVSFKAPGGYNNKVILRNHYPIFHSLLEADQTSPLDLEGPTTTDLTSEETSLPESTGIRADYPFRDLFIFPLVSRATKQQTSKGKIMHQQIFMVVGDGKGMLGLGSGKDENFARAQDKAKIKALKNMDYVSLYENRTIFTEISTKLGATKIEMRPRPLGFGLRCAPVLHQVLKAAGIKDISAKIWGSRHPIVVMQAAVRMLQGGHQPLGMGDGLGGKGRRMNKGCGVRTKDQVERDRGRKLVPLRY